MSLDKGQLRKACFEAARSALFAARPVSVAEIDDLANKYYRGCLIQEEYISGQGRDPNLITSTKSMGSGLVFPTKDFQ